MYSKGLSPWLRIGFDAWSMGIEASTVVGLRCMKIAAGGAAGDTEARLMIDEKVRAAMAMQTALLTGGLGTDPARATARVLRHYSGKVRANRRRLSKG